MYSQATAALPHSVNSNFHSASFACALTWQRERQHWPASKACSFASLLAATVDGLCDAAENNPKFLEATVCEFIQDAHLLMGGRKWHLDGILKAAVPASLHRLEKSCSAICDTFTLTNKLSPAAPGHVWVQCVSSIFLTARSAPQADISWRSVSACISSWCSILLSNCLADAAPKDTASSCYNVLSLVADAVRARLCLDLLTDPSCVQLVCVCCEFQQEDTRLQQLSIELLDIILSFSSPSNSELDCCAVPVTGCGSKCSLVWQPLCPFSLSLVQPYSSMLVALLVSILLPQSSDHGAPCPAVPHVTALNCLRCLNSLLWHDESARHTVLSQTESLAHALSALSACSQASVRNAAVFVRCTFILRCSNVDFIDKDGLSSCVRQRHLLHLFPELVRLRSSSRPQSSSRLRPLSAAPLPMVSSADMIVFSASDSEQKVVQMHGLLHAALADLSHLPRLLMECSELACALLDTATLICISSDGNRVHLAEASEFSECSAWKLLLQSMESSFSCVRVSSLQLAAILRHNSNFLAIMSCSSILVSVLRRSIQRLSRENVSEWDTKAAACACAILHSVVTSNPAVASSLLHGRRFGRSHAPMESADFDAACLQRVYREEDEASDDDTLDEAAPGMASQIFDVENELSDARFMTIDHHSSPRQASSPLSTQSRRTSHVASSPQLLDSPRQNKKTLCVGANGMKRQQRFISGLEQGVLSENFSCRSSAVMLAAELAAVFVLDGSPALAAAAAPFFEPNESNFSISLVSQPSLIFSSSSRIAVLLSDTRCVLAAATLLREPSPCMHLMACKFISWSIKAGAVLQMRAQLQISNNLIHAMDAALLRMLDAHPVVDPLAQPADVPDQSKTTNATKMMTKMKSLEKQSGSHFLDTAATFSPLQVASPADACVWPIASSQLNAVSILNEILWAFAQVLAATDTGVAAHIGANEWKLLTGNIRLLMQRGKYYDLPQFKHKNVQSDATTAAALHLLAACVRARCNYINIIEDSSYLEALFGVMNNPGAMGPNAALRAVLELAKIPDAQRALSSTFGYMTGTKAGASWANSAMAKMSREIKRLCASGGSPSTKASAKTLARQTSAQKGGSFQHDDEEDEDFETDKPEPGECSPLLPPISPSRSSRVATSSPLSRVTTASKGKSPTVSSPAARPPAPAQSTPPASSSRAQTGGRASAGAKSPAAAVLPALR